MLTWVNGEPKCSLIGKLGPTIVFRIAQCTGAFVLIPFLPNFGIGYYPTLEVAKETAETSLQNWLNLAGLKVVE